MTPAVAAAAAVGNRAQPPADMCFMAQVSTLMPWILGTKRWTRHREKLVFVLRVLRTAALQAQFNPKASQHTRNQPLDATRIARHLRLAWL